MTNRQQKMRVRPPYVRSDNLDMIKPNNPNFALPCSRKHHKNETQTKKLDFYIEMHSIIKMLYRICDSGSKADDSLPSFLLFAKQFQNLSVSSPAPVTIT